MLTYEITLGLLTNLLSELMMMPLFRGNRMQMHVDALPAAVEQVVDRSAQVFAERYKSVEPTEEQWRTMLDEGELRAAMELLFATQVGRSAVNLSDVRSIFEIGFDGVKQRTSAFEGVDGGKLFNDLLRISSEVLQAAISKGCIAAADAKAELRHKMLTAELEVLQDMVQPGRVEPDEAMLSTYHSRLRGEVLAHSSRIDLPSTVRHEPVDIDALYVTPQVAMSPSSASLLESGKAERLRVSYQRFLRTARRRVVLGNPGAGKSTLATKICYDVARGLEGYRAVGPSVTPLRVELRKYRASQLGLLDYCDQLISNGYMIGSPAGTFRELLLRRRLLLLFDGLDEILDSEERRTVRNTIETFCRKFPGTDVIVTSRIVGYEQAPLNSSEFDIAVVEEFDDARVLAYASNWFAVDASLDAQSAHSTAGDFHAESQSVDELRRNPLLLALLCALYRGQGYIPDNLPDVYEQCSLLLFQTWDKGRGIESELPFTRHVQPALEDLAYWMYSSPRLAGGVTERQAITQATTYLQRWRFGDAAEARAGARDFIQFCRGRAWVFSDQQSTSPTGEDLFAFTHRTFLEYFTAMYLVSTHSETSDLLDALLPRIKQREWDVVCRITLQMHARGRLGGADDVVCALAETAEVSLVEHKGPILETMLRTVGAMVPSPKALNLLGAAITDAVLNTKGMAADVRRTLLDLVESSGDEVRSSLADAVVRRGIESIASGNLGRRQLSSELLTFLATSPYASLSATAQLSIQGARLALRDAAKRDSRVARNVGPHVATDAERVHWHGPAAVFVRPSSSLLLAQDPSSPLEVAARSLERGQSDAFLSIVDAVASLWTDRTIPSCPGTGVETAFNWAPVLRTIAGSQQLCEEFAGDARRRLGLWTLLAASAELGRAAKAPQDSPDWLRQLVAVVMARRARQPRIEVIRELFEDPKHGYALVEWCRGTTSIFV
ncbi:MAG TPA: NACHT domain-containing protein [Baekduia sp.]|uniref:NACHT domain-containing protein n=1 Tax=Baekduia sp. TaxID=2600305 RepID=UPI002CA59C8B|nr:NACHT domain-containing protein [Baekduia sp.]HMJ33357.1 NACHT domain-containing protein [Baekduia sp.]